MHKPLKPIKILKASGAGLSEQNIVSDSFNSCIIENYAPIPNYVNERKRKERISLYSSQAEYLLGLRINWSRCWQAQHSHQSIIWTFSMEIEDTGSIEVLSRRAEQKENSLIHINSSLSIAMFYHSFLNALQHAILSLSCHWQNHSSNTQFNDCKSWIDFSNQICVLNHSLTSLVRFRIFRNSQHAWNSAC